MPAIGCFVLKSSSNARQVNNSILCTKGEKKDFIDECEPEREPETSTENT